MMEVASRLEPILQVGGTYPVNKRSHSVEQSKAKSIEQPGADVHGIDPADGSEV